MICCWAVLGSCIESMLLILSALQDKTNMLISSSGGTWNYAIRQCLWTNKVHFFGILLIIVFDCSCKPKPNVIRTILQA
ncbi:hypothetical protein BJ166DRAFT_518229 [Pestalotiopsis sp. NC0098]|nr:hypothetical protein BJ166DRAFT_518229 [Pestalotiopsis sp. NC0098]